MSIKEILKNAALLLGRDNVIDYCNGVTVNDDTLRTVNNMTGLINLVLSELACTYIPMVKRETVSASNGKIYYKDLTENALKILGVYNTSGGEVYFKQNAQYLTVNANSVVVEYEYSPSNYGFDDEIGYQEKDVSARVLAYGLCAEFSISEGKFDQAVMWHKRYVDALSEICVPKNSHVKERRWA